MGMVGRSRSSFYPDIKTFSFVPSGTDQGYRHFSMSGPDFRDRRRHFFHIETGTIDQDNRQETLFLRSKMRILACQEYFFVPEQGRIAQFGCIPKHGRKRLSRFACITEIEGKTGRPCHILHEAGRRHKALHRTQPTVRTESRFQRGDQHHVETRPISPIIISFRIVAVRGIHFHRQGDRRHSPFDDSSRLLAIRVQKGKGSIYQTGIANLVPVVFRFQKPVILFVVRRSKTFLKNRSTCQSPCLRRQLIEQPVIADRNRHRHLADIQKMRRVPVVKRADRHHLLLGTQTVFIFAGHPIHK